MVQKAVFFRCRRVPHALAAPFSAVQIFPRWVTNLVLAGKLFRRNRPEFVPNCGWEYLTMLFWVVCVFGTGVAVRRSPKKERVSVKHLKPQVLFAVPSYAAPLFRALSRANNKTRMWFARGHPIGPPVRSGRFGLGRWKCARKPTFEPRKRFFSGRTPWLPYSITLPR